jgi:ATP-dependent DNA helicase RecQ
MTAMDDSHLSALQNYFGYSEFRPLQREIVEDVVNDRDVFVLMPTGGGKSLCYQLPALLKEGVAIVVSPLIALMKDQVDAMSELGVSATFINSSLDPYETAERKDLIRRGAVKMLYCAPERLLLPDFLSFLSSVNISFFAIDEAHCISQWGHDFREDYRKLSALRKTFPKVPIIAMTATATEVVAKDIVSELKLRRPSLYQASFERKNLVYSVLPKQKAATHLIPYLKKHKDESGIIYCFSRKKTEELSSELQAAGFKALPYHAGMEAALRTKTQEQFKRDDINIICATIAFGMGIDKPDVRFVIHHDLPKNLEGYYQETGRAGRDGLPSECILYYRRADRSKITFFIERDITDPVRKRHEYEKLDTICGYAETSNCRKEYLIKYFGEDYHCTDKTKCDICLHGERFETADATVHAQKFLSAIIRTDERFGITYIIDILRGKEDARIMQNRHHLLPTFGVGKELRKTLWQHYANELIREQYIFQDNENFGILKITEKGKEALVNRSDIALQKPPERSRNETVEGQNPDLPKDARSELFEKLRTLRKQIADEQNVAAFVIFHDSVLRDIAALLPKNVVDFGKIIGVGEKRRERYGDRFVFVIRKFLSEHQLEPVAITHTYEPPEIPSTGGLTKQLYEKGLSLSEIADQRGLVVATIASHLEGYIAAGEINNISGLIRQDKIEPIREAFRKAGSVHSLAAAREFLDKEKFSYEDLRFVRAFDHQKQTTNSSI